MKSSRPKTAKKSRAATSSRSTAAAGRGRSLAKPSPRAGASKVATNATARPSGSPLSTSLRSSGTPLANFLELVEKLEATATAERKPQQGCYVGHHYEYHVMIVPRAEVDRAQEA